MRFKLSKCISQQLPIIILMVGSCLHFSTASALERDGRRGSAWDELRSVEQYDPVNAIRSSPQIDRWVKNDRKSYRSRSEVINEVKRRYDATVLKIRFNEQRAVYNVRILMPSGKIRSIQVSAVR